LEEAMSELREAFQLAAALPQLKREAIARVTDTLNRLTISDLHLLADSIEQEYANAGSFQSANGSLAVAIMRKLGVKVRVALWHVVDGRCHHKEYCVGSTTRAKIGNIGDKEWIETWIA
jgi:hypothetical protein